MVQSIFIAVLGSGFSSSNGGAINIDSSCLNCSIVFNGISFGIDTGIGFISDCIINV
jgi:hypothetical protein